MWVRVRSMDGKKCVTLDVSKLTKIEEIREKLVQCFEVESGRQRLFYRGKQMEDGHTLFDYNVSLNDLIQVLIKPVLSEKQNFTEDKPSMSIDVNDEAKGSYEPPAHKAQNSTSCEQSTCKKNESVVQLKEVSVNESDYYKVGDQVEAWDSETGSWYESKIVKITKGNSGLSEIEHTKCDMDDANNNIGKVEIDKTVFDDNGRMLKTAKDSYTYHVMYQGFEEPSEVNLGVLRPRSWKKLKFDELSIGEEVLANYFVDDPQQRGYWFDVQITKKIDTRTNKQLIATVAVGNDNAVLENCKLIFLDEIFRIERPVTISKRDEEMDYWMQTGNIPKRKSRPGCEYCEDKTSVKCKRCSCSICGGKDNPSKQLLCDECDQAFHLWCLDPPLEAVPDDSDDWYCPNCKNDETEVVKAGEKLKESKRKSKMASALGNCSRDWGKGMACVGRTKQCTIVPSNHFGPIPGVEVGTMWKFRLQASEAGVHRPHVAGIHGRENEGAYSIVLAGGYEDDVDNGEEFTYTGSGGRDLSGNKRTAQQSCDQTLTRMNRALAVNCNAAINATVGSTAKNWQGGKPVRVLRSAKGRKESKYCPKEGIRYDGIYKIVKYWSEKGKSGFVVWRYLLRRDDPVPAPWTEAGLKRTQQLKLVMQYPDGYLDILALKQSNKLDNTLTKKRDLKNAGNDNDSKRLKQEKYILPSSVKVLIKKDISNEHLWNECMQTIDNGHSQFISKVEELFMCVCCQDVVYKPITTECSHNVCQGCLTKSFSVGIYTCPVCRFSLGKDYSILVNKTLDNILLTLFPGYENGR